MQTDVLLAIQREVLAAAHGEQPVAVATVIRSAEGSGISPGAKLLVRYDGSSLGSLGNRDLDQAIIEYCQTEGFRRHMVDTLRLTPDGQPVQRGTPRSLAAVEVFIEVVEPPATLIIVGGGHIGLALAQLGDLCGFSVTVVDDRPDYANRERFPMAERVICDDFTSALQSLPINTNTYIVTVTRGHKHDEESLRAVINSPARYIGMIGSRRRVTAVLQHLIAEGVPREAVERVRTPIGLDIGAETPAEIAVSIMAEIILERRGGTGSPMSKVIDVHRRLRSPERSN